MAQEYLFLEKQPILAGTSRLSIYSIVRTHLQPTNPDT